MMMFPVPDGTITSLFDEPRPRSNPGEHIHGAIDIAAASGAGIFAPEPGRLYGYFSIRPNNNDWWNDQNTPDDLVGFPWLNRFYDLYGLLLILRGRSGMTHVMTHTWINQVWKDFKWTSYEDKKLERFPLISFLTPPRVVYAREQIGKVGSAGYSTGPHVHYEIHHSWKDEAYEDRVDPMTVDYWMGVPNGRKR